MLTFYHRVNTSKFLSSMFATLNQIILNMKQLGIALLMGLVFLQFSCKKTEYVESSPQILITVISQYMVPVQGATITLYSTEDELYLKENPITTLQGDSNGQALFEDLEEQRYYFYVEKDGLDNTGDISAVWDPLKIGQRSELVVKLAEPIEY